MRSVKYLIRLQEEQGLNNAATARKLDMTEAAISHYKTGKRVMDQTTCLSVGMALNLSEHEMMQLFVAAGLDRDEKEGKSSAWSKFSQRMMATAACTLLAVAVTLILTPTPANAANMLAPAHAVAENINYAKS